MKKVALIVLSLALAIIPAGCNRDSPVVIKEGDYINEGVSVEEGAYNEPLPSLETGEDPGLVIRTDNRISSREADALLDAVDKQLTDLINTLDRFDDIEDPDNLGGE